MSTKERWSAAIRFSLYPEDKQRLEELAARRDVSIAQIIRDAIRIYLEQHG